LSNLKLGKLAILVAMIGLVFSRYKSFRLMLVAPNTTRMAVFVLIAALSIFYSIWGSHSFEFFLNSLLPIVVIFYFIIGTAVSTRVIKYYFWSLSISAALLSYLTVKSDWVGRLTVGSSYDPNDLAMILVTCLPIIIGIFLVSKGLVKVTVMLIISVLLTAIFLTGSRGGMLGLIAVLTYILTSGFVWGEINLKKLMIGVMIISMAMIIIWSIVPSEIQNQLASLLNIGSDYNVSDSTGRLSIWGRGIDIIISRPYGVGLDSFEIAEGRISNVYQAAHNSLLQVTVELGVLGLIVYLGFFFSTFKLLSLLIDHYKISLNSNELHGVIARECFVYAHALKASLIGYFVTGMFLSQAYAGVLFTLLALASALSIVCKEESNQNIG